MASVGGAVARYAAESDGPRTHGNGVCRVNMREARVMQSTLLNDGRVMRAR